MIAIAVLVLAAAASPLPELDVFGESLPLTTRPADYSPAARARIEAGWISNDEPRLGVPTFFWAPRDPSQANALREMGLTAEQAARRHLFLYAELYRQNPATLAAQPVQDIHDLGAGAVIVRFRKVSNGVPVFRDTLNVVMTQGLQLVALSGYLSPHDHAREFLLAAPTALSLALQDATGAWMAPSDIVPSQKPQGDWQFFAVRGHGPSRARKVMYPKADRLEAAWQVELTVHRGDGPDDGYGYVVSAEDGRLLMRHDQTSDAGYRVWADEAAPFVPWDGPHGPALTPNPTGVLDGVQPPPVAGKLVTVNSIAPVNDPWLPANANELSGNNIEAYADIAFPDGFNTDGGDLRVPASTANVFDWAYDFDKNANASNTQRFAAGTSAFYVTNWAHDVLYTGGFDEKAGNGQRSNLQRGGIENDAVRVEVHHYGARNNASMRTPADGMPGRLRALLFDSSGPSQLGLSADGGALDAGMLSTGPAEFGPQSFDLTGRLVRGFDGVDSGWDGCDPLQNAAEVTGNIALFDTLKCPFVNVAQNAADAGAVGVVIVHANQGLDPMPGPAGLFTPPALLMQNLAGNQLKIRLDAGEPMVARLFRPVVIERDASLDATVVAHEYAHFLSNRLIGDSNGLLNQQSRSLGEGWSDFFALWMMAREADLQVAANNGWKGTFAIGSHARAGLQNSGAGNPAYYLGIRRYPYSANFAKNGLTFKHIQLGQQLPAVPGAPGLSENNEVHNAGEVWASALWEGYTAMLASGRPFEAAREKMLQYLVASMKATPLMPTYLEARDALLAVIAATNPADLSLWSQAFARRGMGFKSTGPDRFSLDNKPVVEDTAASGNYVRVTAVTLDDNPGYCDKDGVLDVGEQGTLKVSLLNVGAGTLSGTKAVVTTTAPGVTFANNGLITFAPIQSFAAASGTFAITLTAATAVTSIPIEVTVTDPQLGTPNSKLSTTLLANADNVPSTVEDANGNVDGWTAEIETTQSFGFEQLFLARNITANEKAFIGPNVAFKGDSTLMSPPLEVGPDPLKLTFQHRWSFEVQLTRAYDGARVEVSTDDGATWAPVTVSPAYNGVIFAQSQATLRGEAAFIDKSPGYPAAWITTTAALGTQYAGKTIRLRFVISTDPSGGAPGWEIDKLELTGLINKPFFAFVTDRKVCLNRAPVVSLGDDRAVDERSMVDLMPVVTDADGNTLTQMLKQTAGPMVTLAGNTFVAPEVMADTALTFELTASDGTLSVTDAVTLTVKNVNRPPVARAGDNQQVNAGTLVTLGGSGTDADGDAMTFAWTQTAGPAVTLSNASAAQPTFTAPQVQASTTLTFTLVANDGKVTGPAASTSVVVEPGKGGCGCAGAPDAFGVFALLLVLLVRARRFEPRVLRQVNSLPRR